MQPKALVRFALSIGALELIPGGRQLNSGRISPYFWNSGLFRTGRTISALASAYASRIAEFDPIPQVLLGPPYKGIPLVTATAQALYADHGIDVGYAFYRKEKKDHGEGGLLVGHQLEGLRVCVVDDVMTSGGSADKAYAFVAANKSNACGLVISFDRMELPGNGQLPATDAFSVKHETSVVAVANFRHFVEILEEDQREHPEYGRILPEIIAYGERYGAL